MGELLYAVRPFLFFQNELTKFQNGCIIEIEGIAEEGRQNTLFSERFSEKKDTLQYTVLYCNNDVVCNAAKSGCKAIGFAKAV